MKQGAITLVVLICLLCMNDAQAGDILVYSGEVERVEYIAKPGGILSHDIRMTILYFKDGKVLPCRGIFDVTTKHPVNIYRSTWSSMHRAVQQ